MASISSNQPVPSFSQALNQAEKAISNVQKGMANQSMTIRECLQQLKAAEASLNASFTASVTPPNKTMEDKMTSILKSLSMIAQQAKGESKDTQEKVGALILAFKNILGKRRKKREDSENIKRKAILQKLKRGEKTENLEDNSPFK